MFKLDNEEEEELLAENSEGYKFFRSKNLTAYAEIKGLKDMIVVYEKKGDAKKFEKILLVENHIPIFESKTLDGIGTQIDILATAKELSDGR